MGYKYFFVYSVCDTQNECHVWKIIMEMRAAEEQLECLLRHLARLNIFPTMSANGSHLHFKFIFLMFCVLGILLYSTHCTLRHTALFLIVDCGYYIWSFSFQCRLQCWAFCNVDLFNRSQGSLSGKCFVKEFQKIKK